MWPRERYPLYFSGFATVLSIDVIRRMSELIMTKEIERELNVTWRRFPVEDVYLGLMAEMLQVWGISSLSFVVGGDVEKDADWECYLYQMIAILPEASMIPRLWKIAHKFTVQI
jgi:hypothetical protein